MSFALAQSSSSVVCQQRPASRLRNVVVAAQRPAVEKKQPNALARIGGASLGAAAAALLMASPVFAVKDKGVINPEKAAQEQLSGGATSQDYQPGKLAEKADSDPNSLPLSNSRYPKGQPLPGDEAKIREARASLKKEVKGQYAGKGMNSKTNTLLDPYGFNQKKDSEPLFNGPPQKK